MCTDTKKRTLSRIREGHFIKSVRVNVYRFSVTLCDKHGPIVYHGKVKSNVIKMSQACHEGSNLGVGNSSASSPIRKGGELSQTSQMIIEALAG